MFRLDQKLANIRAGRYRRTDFVIADAKDGDMGPGMWSTGPNRANDGTSTRYRTRSEFLETVKTIIDQDIVDIMLVSAANLQLLTEAGAFRDSAIKPAIRANDTTDIWVVRGGSYSTYPSRPFRTASLSGVFHGGNRPRESGAPYLTDLGLYSMTFNNDLDADIRTLEAFRAFREEAAEIGFKYFLEVFNPNVPTGISPESLGSYINDSIVRCLAGVVKADRPLFLKIAYNGPKALEELATHDPGLIIGVLGGAAGTTRDCFELLAQAERHGARLALFGRKINLAESPLDMVAMMRQVVDGDLAPAEAVKAYHGLLQRKNIKPYRALAEDNEVTEPALRRAMEAVA